MEHPWFIYFVGVLCAPTRTILDLGGTLRGYFVSNPVQLKVSMARESDPRKVAACGLDRFCSASSGPLGRGACGARPHVPAAGAPRPGRRETFPPRPPPPSHRRRSVAVAPRDASVLIHGRVVPARRPARSIDPNETRPAKCGQRREVEFAAIDGECFTDRAAHGDGQWTPRRRTAA